MIKNILNLLKCCYSKKKQQLEELDIKIINNMEIKKILTEYKIEDRDFNTFYSEITSFKTANSKNENYVKEYSSDTDRVLDTNIIEESKENKINFIRTNSIKSRLELNCDIDKDSNTIKNIENKNQIPKAEEQYLYQYQEASKEDSDLDQVIVSIDLIRDDEKDFIRYVLINFLFLFNKKFSEKIY